jgi:CubicO group peptidase (beta-lactamase class C family)
MNVKSPRRREWLVWAGAALGTPALASGPSGGKSVCGTHGRLCELLRDVASDGTNTHGVYIRRGDEVLAEAYYTGSDKPGGAWFARTVTFDADTLHDLRSISKSVVGLLVGVAIGRGLLGDPATALEQPVYEFFPEHADLLTAERRAITLRHVLDMSAGWEWDETSVGYGNPLNSETRMGLAFDPLRYVLSRPQAVPPGRRWEYCGGATVVLAELLERVGKAPLADLAQGWLMEPLAIPRFEWRTGLNGKALSYSGLRLAPRDLARIARLLLTEGRHGDRQLLPAAWVVESSTRRHTGWDGYGYGVQWWQGPFELGPGRGVGWTAGWGNGGQRVYAVPAVDLVMVVTAGRYNQPNNGRASNALVRRVIDIVATRA